MASLTMRGRRLVAAVLVLGLVGGVLYAVSAIGGDDDPAPGDNGPGTIEVDDRIFETNDPIERGCALAPEILKRIERGTVLEHTEDLLFVPAGPQLRGHVRYHESFRPVRLPPDDPAGPLRSRAHRRPGRSAG